MSKIIAKVYNKKCSILNIDYFDTKKRKNKEDENLIEFILLHKRTFNHYYF